VKGNSRYPELEVSGSYYEMGYTHGEACRQKILHFLEVSFEQIQQYTGLQSEQARENARKYVRYIEQFDPDLMSEIRGIADGAHVTLENIMVLQVRTLLMYGSEHSCTSFVLEPSATAEGTRIIGQNFDWDPVIQDVCLVIKRHPKEKQSTMCFTQAGLISYMGMSSEGMCVCMNLLQTSGSRYGVPIYFLLRSIYNQRTIEDCIKLVTSTRNARAMNLLIGNRQGAVDLEITAESVKQFRPSASGFLAHTNHFVDPQLSLRDNLVKNVPDSISRYDRINRLLDTPGLKHSVESMKIVMSDHNGYPGSICYHPSDQHRDSLVGTVCSMIMEPNEARMSISHGNPCENDYEMYRL
jgi:isopenicillin-N N-acyltransferase-like protein